MNGNTLQEFWIRIKSGFDKSGTDAAKISLREAANEALNTGNAASKAATDSGEKMNIMAAASALMRGNFMEAGNAIVPLLEKVKMLGLSITQLSLAGALLTGIFKMFQYIAKSAEEAADKIARMKGDIIAREIDKATDAYARQEVVMKRMSTLRDAEYDYQNKLIEANKQQALSILELAKQKELAANQDASRRAEIESRYAREQQDVEGRFEAQAGNAASAYMRRKQADDAAAAMAKQKQADDALDRAARLNRLAAEEGKRGGDVASSRWKSPVDYSLAWMGGSLDAANKRGQEFADAAKKELEKAQALYAEAQALSDSSMYAGRGANVQDMTNANTSRSREASTMAANTAEQDRQRQNQEAMYAAGQQLTEVASNFHPIDQQQIAIMLREMENAGTMTVEAIQRQTQMLDRINKAYQDQEARARNN